MKILFLPGSRHSPSARFRLWQFVEPLRQLGHEVEIRVITPDRNWSSPVRMSILRSLHSRLGSLARVVSATWITRDIQQFDVVMMNRDLIPEARIHFLEPWLIRRNKGVIFDFDDAIFLGRRAAKLRQMLPLFAWITPGNDFLANFAKELNTNITIFPTVVDSEKYQPVEKRTTGPIRIGWSGSRSTLSYCLPLLKDVITHLSKEEDFEFLVIADVPPEIDWPGVKLRYIPWTAESEVEGLQQIDIGLMPLDDSPFERGKCGLKAIQYMGVGIPALVSPVGVNREIVIHGETGYHCATPDEWGEYLHKMLHDEPLRKRMGRAGRLRMEACYSVKSRLPEMLNVFEMVSTIQ